MKTANQKLLLILLGVASLATSALIGFNVMVRDHGRPDAGRSELAGARLGDSLFDQGRELPAFTLIERSGQAFASDQLDGKVWIADFIFTRCAGTCPMMTTQMASLQRDLATHRRWDDIRLVSISVDPQHDTPDRLRRYAQRYGADDRHWLFLTGDRRDIWKLSKEGFLLSVGDNLQNTAMPIFHSQKFVLVDRRGRIRGYYDGLQKAERDRLKTDLERILAVKPSPAGRRDDR